MPRDRTSAPGWSRCRSSKAKIDRPLAAGRGGPRVLEWRASICRCRRAEQQRAGAGLEPAAQQGVQLRHARWRRRRARSRACARPRRAAGRHPDPPALDDEVVVAAAVVDAAQLRDPQAPALAPRTRASQLLQAHDPVGEALQLQVRPSADGQVVEQEHRAAPADEVLLERQDLPAVAERALGEQPHLRERVEDEPLRLDALDLGRGRPWSSRRARPRRAGTWCSGCRRCRSHPGRPARRARSRRATSRVTSRPPPALPWSPRA